MKIELNFGEGVVTGHINKENILMEVGPKTAEGLENPLETVEKALENPIGTGAIYEIVKKKKPQKVVVVVNDVTRPTPYKFMLPPLMKELEGVGLKDDQITLVVATGIHRANTDEENRQTFTSEIVDRYRVVSHNPDENLVSLGKMSDGTELSINREVAEADMVITTGLIGLHYFAGYSGGRKSILPGVAARELITANHAMMTDPRAATGSYKENPVHWIMLEAARMAGVDFILNVVTNVDKEIVSAVAGDVEAAWLEGVRFCEETSVVKLTQQADVVIASAGGHPKDLNLYQAQKALENAASAVRPGGTIILVSKCGEGYGEDVFEKWIKQANVLQDIFDRFDRHFILGGHKAFAIARVLKEKDVILVSDMSRDDVEKLFFSYAGSLQEALDRVKEKYKGDFTAFIMPQASLVLPEVE